ncbi:MAG: magnesium transporter [Candidatus Sericytochromatia bacterium]|nr:magnesium transporter [Candidatus Tanganyikabacteria bacterium]
MLFLSQLLDRPVFGTGGDKLGSVNDLTFRLGEPFPQVTGLVLKAGRARRVVPWERFVRLEDRTFEFRLAHDEVAQCPLLTPDVALLALDVMDSQVVDINGANVVRVNDVQLNFLGHQLWVVGVDIGLWGLARRLGLVGPLAWLNKLLPWKTPEGIVRWDLIDPMEKEISKVRLRVSHDRLTRLHPADLADIVEELGHDQRSHLLQAMNDAQIADLVEESSPEMQATILEELGTDRAADILEEMEPDEAADLLAELPEKRARQLIGLMEEEEASEVKELMAHEEDTVGAIMTTAYLEVRQDWTVERTLAWYREHSHDAELYAYLYAVDASNRLTGVLSIRGLLLAEPEARLSDLFPPQIYSVRVDEPPDEAVEMLVHYKLLAVPVVDEYGILVGVVGVHDVLDVVVPDEDR